MLTDDAEAERLPPTRGTVENSFTGNPTTAVQLRDLHGGSLYINSPVIVSPGPGSTHPLDGDTGLQALPSTLHVLVVDDDPDVLVDLPRLLDADSRIGKVGTASDAAEALRYIQHAVQSHEPLDALFLDVQMPGFSGLDLAGVTGACFSTPPKIVFVTSYEAHAVEAFKLDAVDYLVKPVQPQRLIRTVDRLMTAAPPLTAPPDTNAR